MIIPYNCVSIGYYGNTILCFIVYLWYTFNNNPIKHKKGEKGSPDLIIKIRVFFDILKPYFSNYFLFKNL